MEEHAQISEKRQTGDLDQREVQAYFDSGRIGFWKLELQDDRPTKMYVDANMRALTGLTEGLSPEENYSFFYDHIQSDDRLLLTEYREDVQKGEAVVEYRYCHPTEGEKHIRCSGRILRSEGEVMTVVGLDQELSEVIHVGQSRQRANRLLRQNRRLEQRQLRTDDYYKSLMDMVICGVISYTVPDHRLLHMNAEALRICGAANLEEAQRQMVTVWRGVVYSDEGMPEKLKQLYTGDGMVDYECAIRTPGGRVTQVLARSEAFSSPQGERCVVTTFLDISENLVLKNALAASNRKNEVIGAISRLFWQVFSVDLRTDTYREIFTNGTFMLDNPRYTGTACVDFAKAVQRFADEAWHAQLLDFLDHHTLPDRLADTDTIAMEYETKQGFWISARYVVQTRDADGRVTAVLFLLQQIDEQKRKELEYQKELEKTAAEARRANEAKTNFLRRMSHDIRTPLNGIIGLLKIDEGHFEDRELVKENHKKMEGSANYLLSLINDVLQTSKLEDGRVQLTHELIRLTDLTQDIVNIIIGRAVEAGIKWNYEKGKVKIPYPYIYGSPVHLRQIFLNIYGNCIKYNRPGGMITTIVDTLPEHDGIGTYRWKISDTGIGMSREFLKHIFDPFTQENTNARSTYQGIGLGMFIVKGLIDQMGGSIRVTSEEGVGSTFEIILPFEIAPAPVEAETPEQASEESIRGRHLMLAEDNELNAEIAKVLLMDEGAVVTVVSDGRQAVDLFAFSEPGTFDAILMDIMMPVMDGLTAAKTIRVMDREDAKAIPILAMTANAFREDEEKCLKAGMNAHLTKPLDMEKVKRELVACLGV